MSRLNYLRAGEGEPLLLLHGTGDSLATWQPLFEQLAASYAIVAVDLPGFGRSPVDPAAPPTAPGFAGAVASLLDELGWETAHLVGNSTGGWTALELAKEGRARSVTAFSPAGLWPDDEPFYVYLVLRSGWLLARAARPLVPLIAHSRAARTLALAVSMARPWQMPAAAAAAFLGGYAEGKGMRSHLAATRRAGHFVGGRSITVPVTVAFGSSDRILLRRWRNRSELPAHTRWISLDGCGHVPMWDDPSLVASVILATSAPTGQADRAF